VKILVVAPHGDDGTIACGGSMAKWIGQGHKIHYHVFYTVHQAEVFDALQVIGDIPITWEVEYEIRNFSENRQKILDMLLNEKKDLNPDLVVAPCPKDIHQDHSVISQEVLRAFKDRSILGYEMPWNNVSIDTECFVALGAEDMVKKVDSVSKHKSQSGKPYTDPDFLRSWARTRGMQIGKPYAEVFEVVRWIL